MTYASVYGIILWYSSSKWKPVNDANLWQLVLLLSQLASMRTAQASLPQPFSVSPRQRHLPLFTSSRLLVEPGHCLYCTWWDYCVNQMLKFITLHVTWLACVHNTHAYIYMLTMLCLMRGTGVTCEWYNLLGLQLRLNYASVHMRRRHTIVSLCFILSVIL